MIIELLTAAAITLITTPALAMIIVSLGRNSSLYTDIRGGTPRGVGFVPFIVLVIFSPEIIKFPLFIMGLAALVDDITGRRRIKNFAVEFGQLSRGLGIIAVSLITYPFMGAGGVLAALMVQPLNIADMQPGTACTSIILMSTITALIGWINASEIYLPLLLIFVCLAYSPMDYRGSIMMGEVGNHAFAVALGISFYMAGGFLALISLFFITPLVIAVIRGPNLCRFLSRELGIEEPTLGDRYMDVLTGGGLGDLIRRFLLQEKNFKIENRFLRLIGARRLLYNPKSL